MYKEIKIKCSFEGCEIDLPFEEIRKHEVKCDKNPENADVSCKLLDTCKICEEQLGIDEEKEN
jgi:hypothetical protein